MTSATMSEKDGDRKNFVFVSAAKSIAPMFKKYSDMKEEAENFLLNDKDCLEKLNTVILRPGLIWHPS